MVRRLFTRDAPAGAPSARALSPADRAEVLAVCDQDPVAATLATARLREWSVAGLGGAVWGFPAVGRLRAVCWSGANLFPVVPAAGSDREDALDAFAAIARRQGRRSSSIVGDRSVALGLWDRLSPFWPAPREIRAEQPSMVIAGEPLVEPDPLVRRATLDEMAVVLPACVRMFVEEVGYSPVAGGSSAYERRVRALLALGRSFVRVERGSDGATFVAFKAELGAVSDRVAQVQGVWVDPLRRGHRLSETGMAAVVELTRRDVAPVVSLYVNGFNIPALRSYRRIGFEQVGTFATVLF
jgi:hypothetical protein